ncbi:hypothetical protein P153DRAFT_295156 [Dothidotthia symphoricarpi CBS 119687]|uniref:MYND-type domain-containing protein n=1 Tax=Dothidotthia symphoricarpi CBS 119687 TaxID=1392245 RepID=A0A6A6A6C7_9PLEO|nr:uncharacterized protein P153DRAFT_295156 [Dothidotthia symphoricarpi CBS 119687]KAF2127532.1 hypothetical protein P153DRAFT_295156 [Dothidotthia symphoricarpi CBS 119687]
MSESFDWNHQGLNWSHFHSLANLLSLRNGGQAEPSSLSDIVLEEDWNLDDNEDGDAASLDTRLAHKISDSGHGRLKRRFLDCLAEFAANKKGGTAVACSAMKEAEDNVVIWVARNEGFSDVDKPVFDRLGKLLASLSRSNAGQSEALLWEEMVLYHQDRIEHSYIPDLRASFKAYDHISTRKETDTPENNSASDAALSALRTLLFDRNTNNISTFEKHAKLVIASYNLRRTRNVEEILHSSSRATSKSKSLWLHICLFARLRVTFQNCKDIALTLPSFEQVTIILVPRPLAPANPSQNSLNLNQTFGVLQLDLTPDTAKAVLGQNWTVAKAKGEFAKRQKQKPNIHAEVQMLIFLTTNESAKSGLLPYFGCSKLSCFMCNRFVQSYGRFTTRGCHGRLFRPWTVPSVDRLLPGQADRIAKALMSVQKAVKRKLKASVGGHIRHERTSVMGGSSVLDGRQEECSQRQSTGRVHEPLEGDESEWECDICMRLTTRKCNICNKGSFCSDDCQEKRSGRHLFTCSKRPLTSADYLWMSLTEDRMPQEEDVLEDFGFNNVSSVRDMSYLLGVYGGLYLSGRFSAEEIHEWRVGGILVDKIKDFYYSIPESSRGGYFPWYLENLSIFERPMTKAEAQQKLIATFYDKSRPYLDIEDRNKTARELKPEAKGASYDLLAAILLQMSPHPIQLVWYSFGFVTCRGQGEESMLVSLYKLLLTKSDGSPFYEINNRQRGNIQPATFTQFWKAYEAGRLIQLMDSKGLKEIRSELPFLEGFLSVPPVGSRPSVWDLKQFLEISDPMDHPPVPSVNVDYGFINCRTFEETCTLMEIYGKVLKTAKPLELHQACVAGNLFEFASSHLRMEERWRPLMRNFYTL